MNKVFSDDPHSAELMDHVKREDMIVFVGSGLSAGEGGYPAWWELVEKLRMHCGLDDEPPVTKHTSANRLQELAQKARDKDPTCYVSVLQADFAKTVLNTRRAYDLLLRSPFVGYVTTNFDPLLAIALAANNSAKKIHAYPELDHLELRSKTAFYLHGYIAEGSTPVPERIVLCKDDFEAAYDPQCGPLPLFWESLLRQCPVLFLGCNLGEPELEFIFTRCNSVRTALEQKYGIQAKKRFVLLPPSEEIKTVKTRDEDIVNNAAKVEADSLARFEKYDITVVRYDPKDRRYSGLIEVLQEWARVPSVEVYTYNSGDIPYE